MGNLEVSDSSSGKVGSVKSVWLVWLSRELEVDQKVLAMAYTAGVCARERLAIVRG